MTGPDQESLPDNPSSAWLAHYEEASKRRRARGSRRSRNWSRKTRRRGRMVIITTVAIVLAAVATLFATAFRVICQGARRGFEPLLPLS